MLHNLDVTLLFPLTIFPLFLHGSVTMLAQGMVMNYLDQGII